MKQDQNYLQFCFDNAMQRVLKQIKYAWLYVIFMAVNHSLSPVKQLFAFAINQEGSSFSFQVKKVETTVHKQAKQFYLWKMETSDTSLYYHDSTDY